MRVAGMFRKGRGEMGFAKGHLVLTSRFPQARSSSEVTDSRRDHEALLYGKTRFNEDRGNIPDRTRIRTAFGGDAPSFVVR